jgi:hypothetical protein
MSDFEVTDGEEEDILSEKGDNVVREVREEANKWFRMWDKASTSKDGGDPINDPDAESDDSETFHSMDSEEEEDEGEGPRRRVRRYPEWRPKRDLKDIITLTVGLKFSNPTEFKETLKVFAVKIPLTICTSTMRRCGSPRSARKNVAGEYTQVGRIVENFSRSKLFNQFIIVVATTITSGQQLRGLLIDI